MSSSVAHNGCAVVDSAHRNLDTQPRYAFAQDEAAVLLDDDQPNLSPVLYGAQRSGHGCSRRLPRSRDSPRTGALAPTSSKNPGEPNSRDYQDSESQLARLSSVLSSMSLCCRGAQPRGRRTMRAPMAGNDQELSRRAAGAARVSDGRLCSRPRLLVSKMFLFESPYAASNLGDPGATLIPSASPW
jgi:hypothetical protein